ncbi:MAG: patatin-like phospholipase family protein [Flavobacteriales bacterium]|nr:patatin-like phospholipase family protein [Flavobacteriales bacterium]
MQEPIDVKAKLNQLETGQSINLVLSGGAMKGVAHLPLLEFLEEKKIKINAISASSAGAVVAVMYASGIKPKDILQFFIDNPLFRYSWIKPGKGGVFNTLKYIQHFENHVKHHFEELSIPVHICATNLTKAQPEYFNQGELLHRLIASCAVPGIYKSVKLNGDLYADGGVMDNFPIQPFLEEDLPIVGSFVRIPSEVDLKDLSSTSKIVKRSVLLQRYAVELLKFERTAVTILNDLNKYSAYKQKDAQAIYDQTKKIYF